MIAEPQPTPYDLSFRLFRFPVRVHPLFWVVTLLLGASAFRGEHPIPFALIWVGVVFVSILAHELGHGLAFRWFGSPARMWLYWFGGLAVSEYPPRRPLPMIAVSLAGPAAGFLLAGALYGLEQATRWRSAAFPYTDELYYQLMWVNIGWGLVNLLPVLPLDGGRVCRDVCRLAGVRKPEVAALRVSVGTGIAMAAFSLMNYLGRPRELIEQLPDWARVGSLYVTLMFGVLAYGSYQTLQATNRRYLTWDEGYDEPPPWRNRG